jgi:hypothetical protein
MNASLYRFHFLDHRNHVRRSTETHYSTDAFACNAARLGFGSEPIEVWQDRRFVCRMDDTGIHIAATTSVKETEERSRSAEVE